jgi:excisionase family DNA binding protein
VWRHETMVVPSNRGAPPMAGRGIPAEVTDSKLAVDVPGAAERLSIGERTVWDLVHSGRLRSVRIGRRVVIPVAALDEFLNGDAA